MKNLTPFAFFFLLFVLAVTLGASACGIDPGAPCGPYTGDPTATAVYLDDAAPTVWSKANPDGVFRQLETTVQIHNPGDAGMVRVRCDFRLYPDGVSLGMADADVAVCAESSQSHTLAMPDLTDPDDVVVAFCKVEATE